MSAAAAVPTAAAVPQPAPLPDAAAVHYIAVPSGGFTRLLFLSVLRLQGMLGIPVSVV